jgi:glycosyltransferase involved in cell wall biosynthesis
MRIAQVAPLYESVPPQLYGGTERVVSYLTEELVRQGHDVTLFASGDSKTKAKLVPVCERSLRLDDRWKDQYAHHALLLEQVFQRLPRFDIVHFHIDYLHFPLSRRHSFAHVTTLHGRLDIPDLQPLYQEYADMPLVSISNDQRRPLPWANWQGTVYHGLPENLYTFREKGGDYLAFLGRVCADKGLDQAIEIAVRTGRKLKIAAKVDRADQAYYEDVIRPMLDKAGSSVEFIGEVGGKDKDDFLGGAQSLLFPINWPEPFGLVMIEAMACGTPVIAYPCGSVPEVMEDGATGFVVKSADEAARAVERADKLSRARCRQVFEERFSDRRMTRDYLAVYRRVIAQYAKPALPAGSRLNGGHSNGKARKPARPVLTEWSPIL